MATLLLLTNDMHASGGDPARPRTAAPSGQGRPGRGDRPAGRPGRRRHPARCAAGPGRRPLAVPADRDHRQGVTAAGHRQRGRPGGAVGGLGVRRPAAGHRRSGRGRCAHPAGHDPAVGRQRRSADPVRQHRHRRSRLQRQAQRRPARPDLHRVRAAEVPGPASRSGVQPPAAAQRRVGLRLLRRHPDGRRARPPAAGQARTRVRVGHRHRAQRGLPLRDPGRGPSRIST